MTLFFFNDTATTEIYTLSLHDALPIWGKRAKGKQPAKKGKAKRVSGNPAKRAEQEKRSEEHTSELQSRQYTVCRLLLEKKKRSGVPRCTPRPRGGAPRATPWRWR